MLKMNSKVHIIGGVNNHVDEVHASDLEVGGSAVGHEIFHEFFEAVLFCVGQFEVVHGLEDFDVTSFDQAHRG